MPGWQPPWQDVRFDHAAALELAASLDTTADRLAAHLDLRATAAARVRSGWTGQHRDRFDIVFPASQRDGHDLVVQCRRVAAAVRAASDAARLDQAHRERLRAQWQAERAAEEVRAARVAERARAEEAAALGSAAQAPMAW